MQFCDFETTHEEHYLHICKACGRTVHSSRAKITRPCRDYESVNPNVSSAVSQLPEETQRLLIGDRVKQLTDALGIPTCGGCNARREWLNKADAYIRQMWS